MKIEVGMYVRSDNGMKLGKVIEVHNVRKSTWYKLDNGVQIDKSELIRNTVANDIINLIEVGDVIIDSIGKKNEVTQIYSPEGKYTLWIQLSNKNFIDSTNVEEIKSIVTKEQFEVMGYKVGE